LSGKEFTVSSTEEFFLALKSSENNQEDDTIILKKGRYVASPDYIFSYISTENFDLTIEAEDGARRSDVIIDGNGLSSVIFIENSKYKIIVTLSRLTIQNGSSEQKGGGVLMENIGELNLDSVTIAYNKSQYDGAGVYNQGTVIINESIIARNESLRGVGGGVFTGKNAIVKLSNISYNKAYKHGGALFSTKTALVKDSTFSYNESSYGGAFYGLSKIKVGNTIFTNNSAKYDGGAIKCEIIKANDLNLSNNSAGNYGGAIFGVRVDLENSFAFENSAKYGGVIFADNIQAKNNTFKSNSADYSGGALKGNNILLKDSSLNYNKSKISGGGIDTNQVVVSNCELIENESEKGGAIFSKSITITNSTILKNHAKSNGGALKGYDIKIRYSSICENSADSFGGGIDGVDIGITNSNISRNRSYKGGGIYSTHTSKLDITNSLMYQNSAYYGGAIFGNVKMFNSLMINNSAKGMTLYGKGTLINNVIKNITAPDLVSQEIFMTGNLKLENNYLNMSNIYNYQLYKLQRKGNLALAKIETPYDLSYIFGEQSHVAKVGLTPDFRKSCLEIFDVRKAYNSLLQTALIDTNSTTCEDNETIIKMERNRKEVTRSSLIADISDLMIEGDQKVFNELYFVIIVRSGKSKVDKYFIDFDEGKGFEEIKGNSVTHRFHNSGIKDIKVKIVDVEENEVVKEFPLDIYELSQDEFRELLSDKKTRSYLENLSKGVLNVAENPDGTRYSSAIDLLNSDREGSDDLYLRNKYGKLLSELSDESASSNEFNISKMVQFNNGVNEVKEYILNNLEEFNLVSIEDSKDAIDNAKKYIIENPKEFNLTSFKNYEEIIIEIQKEILSNLDEYNLTYKKNIDIAYEDGKDKVISNPKAFNLMSMSDLQGEMQKLTIKIKEDPSKYGIKVTRAVLDSLDKGWSLLGTLAEIDDISIFDGFKIIWIFADGEFKGYSPSSDIRRKIRNARFDVFDRVPKNAGIWLYK
jgi:predicted outer membrane repeat protein